MRPAIFVTVCVLASFMVGKYLPKLEEYIEQKRRRKEWTEFLEAMAKLFKVADDAKKEEEESQ